MQDTSYSKLDDTADERDAVFDWIVAQCILVPADPSNICPNSRLFGEVDWHW